MKGKLLIVSLLLWIGSFAQSVPNSAALSLRNDVYPVVLSHAPGTTASLSSLFANSVDAYFDPAHKGVKDRLSNFQNYTVNNSIACNTSTTISVTNATYPEIHYVNVGSGTGTVTLTFNPSAVPDLVKVYWNGFLVISTGYIGSADYACEGQFRQTQFNAYLNGKADPIYGGTYPNANYPECYTNGRYPVVTVTSLFTGSFPKTNSASTVTIYVYPSKSSSGYTFTLSCPQ